MSTNSIQAMMEKWVEFQNSRDWQNMRSLYADDVLLYQAPIKTELQGWDHIQTRLKAFATMSEDSRLTIRDFHVSGNTGILEFNLVGTHTGRFLDYDPTGRRFDIDSCLVFKVEDSKIIKHTTYLDVATVLRALEIIHTPKVLVEVG